MKPVVYLDILFLVNFCMDAVIIYSASLMIKRQIHIFRLTASASFSALYGVIAFFPQLTFMLSVFFKLVSFIIITLIAFPSRNLLIIAKNTLMFFIANCIFGGIIFFLIFYTDFGIAMGTVISNGEIYFNLSASKLICFTICAYIFIYIFSYLRKVIIKQEKHLSDLQIVFENSSVSIKAFADTGCMAEDPLTHVPLVIIDNQTATKLLGKNFQQALNRNFSHCDDIKYINRFRIIPYCTIDSCSVMNAFVPDSLFINEIHITNAVIGISKTDFSEASGFNAIYNPKLSEYKNTLIQSGGTPYVEKSII